MKRYISLDFIRGFSAFLVLANHLRSAIFFDYAQQSNPSPLIKLFYFITGLGHQSVIIFFVLSGFLVGGSILKQSQRFNWTSYYIARLTRLWVVLIPALILTVVIDYFITAQAPNVINGQYAEIWSSGPTFGNYSRSLSTFLGNLFFLQNIFFKVYGSNGPLWSLAYEFWYYTLFPVLLLSLGKLKTTSESSRPIQKAVAALISITILVFLPLDAKIGFLSWCLGALMYWLYKKEIKIINSTLISFIIFLSVIFFSKFSQRYNTSPLLDDLLIGIGFSLLMLSLISNQSKNKLIHKTEKYIIFISEISYSLYLIHFPIIIFIASRFYKENQMSPTLLGFAHYASWLLLITLLSYSFWLAFESQTEKIKKKIMTKVS